jgi:membrane-associated phospholipid phosphatase
MSRIALIDLPPNKLDIAVADASARHATPGLERTLGALTWLADEKLLLTGAGLAWAWTHLASDDRKLWRNADQMLCSVAIAGVVPHLFKWAVARERPDRTRIHGNRHGIPKSGNAWDSFPSGHAVHVGALAHAAMRMTQPAARPWIWPAAAALASTRIVLLAHYLSDVIAGLALGVVIDKAVRRVFRASRTA